MTGRRHFSFIVLAAALLAALAVFAFPPAAVADHAASGQTLAASAQYHCPDGDCAGDPAGGQMNGGMDGADYGCCVGAMCGGAWLAPQAPVAAPAAFVRVNLTIPPGRLAAGVGAPPDPRPPRSFV